jgi:hypothetical protein
MFERVPLVLAAAILVYGRWRARRQAQAGWLMAGVGIPPALVWGLVLASPTSLVAGADPITTVGWAAAGLALVLIGGTFVLRGDPALPPPDIESPAGQPGSRAYGGIAEAIRATGRVGPFGLPEMALLVAVIVSALVVPLLIPAQLPRLIQIGIEALIVALAGTEAFVRGWIGPNRRAFEAFSWLGEWELARARQITGEAVPTSKRAAAAWLDRHRERPDELSIRIELLAFVGRFDEGRRLITQMPATTPWESFDVAALADLVDWHSGGAGDLPAMEAAAARILPLDGDERLRAEVSIAAAKVRRRIAQGGQSPVDVVQPLLEARDRLGRRADGQVGRALRRRILPMLVAVSIVLLLLGDVLGWLFPLGSAPVP